MVGHWIGQGTARAWLGRATDPIAEHGARRRSGWVKGECSSSRSDAAGALDAGRSRADAQGSGRRLGGAGTTEHRARGWPSPSWARGHRLVRRRPAHGTWLGTRMVPRWIIAQGVTQAGKGTTREYTPSERGV